MKRGKSAMSVQLLRIQKTLQSFKMGQENTSTTSALRGTKENPEQVKMTCKEEPSATLLQVLRRTPMPFTTERACQNKTHHRGKRTEFKTDIDFQTQLRGTELNFQRNITQPDVENNFLCTIPGPKMMEEFLYSLRQYSILKSQYHIIQ